MRLEKISPERPKNIPNLLYVDLSKNTKEFFNLVSQQGLEGMVGKDKLSPYVSGRETWYWLKIKNRSFKGKRHIRDHFDYAEDFLIETIRPASE